jgi:hypothetical protein
MNNNVQFETYNSCMVHGGWFMVYLVWCMAAGAWYILQWCMAAGAWHSFAMVHGSWCMAQFCNGAWQLVHGTLCMVHFAW